MEYGVWSVESIQLPYQKLLAIKDLVGTTLNVIFWISQHKPLKISNSVVIQSFTHPQKKAIQIFIISHKHWV